MPRPFKSKAKISEKEAADIALKAHPGKIIETSTEQWEIGEEKEERR